jgi:hypothetical protein
MLFVTAILESGFMLIIRFLLFLTYVIQKLNDIAQHRYHCDLVEYIYLRKIISRIHLSLSFLLSRFIIISQLIPPLLGHRPSLWITHKENVP